MDVRWQGPCQDGRAHGEGIRTLLVEGFAVAASRSVYEHGFWVSDAEKFVLHGAVLVRSWIDPSGQRIQNREIPDDQHALIPPWARSLLPGKDRRQRLARARQMEIERSVGNHSNRQEADQELESNPPEDFPLDPASAGSVGRRIQRID
jgi:hypothetical protein